MYAVRETNARLLANASAFWAGLVENWPGQVKFCIEHIKNICLRASTTEMLVSHIGMRPANERRRYTVTASLIGWVHT